MLAAFSRVMLKDEIRFAAERHVPVLITAGDHDQRELCARIIHASWDGGRGPFVTFLATAPSVSLHASNAAPHCRGPHDYLLLRRKFEGARGGTLFIDDVTLLSAEGQEQLFSLLDESLPSTAPDAGAGRSVRLIAGASHHLDAERATGAFSESLFYRLNVIHFDFLTKPIALGA
jgi:two-component system response regulator HydG